MPPKRRLRDGQSPRATRQSARQQPKPESGVPDVYGEMLAEVAKAEKATASKPPSRRRTGQTAQRSAVHLRKQEDELPGVYGERIAEALAEEQAESARSRPLKRRKASEEPSSKIELDIDFFGVPAGRGTPAPTETDVEQVSRLQQVTLTEFDSATESDVEFEDVELDPTVEEANYDDKPEQKTLELNLSNMTTSKRAAPRRKPISVAERRLRLAVHKTHIVMLLSHLKCRNQWCNSESVHAILKPLIPRKITSLLHVDETKTQYERNQSFMQGIEEVCTIWKDQWTIVGRGIRRAHWREDLDAVKEADDAEDLCFYDFKAAAVAKQGSRDVAAQLFCALLRSVALEVRLVCSLQVLPFSSAAKGQTLENSKQEYIYAPPQNYNSGSGTPGRKETNYAQSMYPVFWVEVFSPAIQTWIPLDPIVRYTINKPKSAFEPYGNDNYNKMSYVIGFEDDGSAKDVTKRYTQFYNSKVRKHRVESTPGGEKWWEKTMRALEKPFREPKDDIEDAFLQKRTESEPMPTNIQDFKGHSIYVLERHLRLNEVIHPPREVGKVTIGVAKNAKVASVFRRRDVHVCRAADAWYRRGRDVKEGEQPLKRVIARRRQTLTADDLDDDEEANEDTALYAEFQTSVYTPPPVVDGKVPRNAYGNLDVYVPSMIPPGAVHIRHPLASKAARVLGIDYAEAVTGFQFKGRQGTAVVDGVVVSMNMTNALITVIEGLESEASEEAQESRERIVLAIWKRWLTALRVREHVQTQYGDRADGLEGIGLHAHGENEDDATYQPEDDGGGFMLEVGDPDQSEEEAAHGAIPLPMPDLRPLELPPEVVHQEIVVIRSPHKLTQPPAQELAGKQVDDKEAMSSTASGGRSVLADNTSATAIPGKHDLEADDGSGSGFILEDEDNGGGFIPEADEGGGGFLPEDEDPLAQVRTATADDGSNEEQEGGFLPDMDIQSSDSMTIDKAITRTVLGNTEHGLRGLKNGSHEANSKQPLLPPDIAITQASENTTGTEPITKDPPSRTADSLVGHLEAGNKGSPASVPSPGSLLSLLSHDPDEDDAEPEWLLNSLGEIE